MSELSSPEFSDVEQIPVQENATFDQLLELAAACRPRPILAALENRCIDNHGAQMYEQLLQNPEAWNRIYAGITHSL